MGHTWAHCPQRRRQHQQEQPQPQQQQQQGIVLNGLDLRGATFNFSYLNISAQAVLPAAATPGPVLGYAQVAPPTLPPPQTTTTTTTTTTTNELAHGQEVRPALPPAPSSLPSSPSHRPPCRSLSAPPSPTFGRRLRRGLRRPHKK